MRWPLPVVVDFVKRRLAADDVIGDIFGVGGTADSRRHVRACNIDADAMAAPEQICRSHNLDGVLGDFSGNDFLLSLPALRDARASTAWSDADRALDATP